jgi:hypothetical protein
MPRDRGIPRRVRVAGRGSDLYPYTNGARRFDTLAGAHRRPSRRSSRNIAFPTTATSSASIRPGAWILRKRRRFGPPDDALARDERRKPAVDSLSRRPNVHPERARGQPDEAHRSAKLCAAREWTPRVLPRSGRRARAAVMPGRSGPDSQHRCETARLLSVLAPVEEVAKDLGELFGRFFGDEVATGNLSCC